MIGEVNPGLVGKKVKYIGGQSGYPAIDEESKEVLLKDEIYTINEIDPLTKQDIRLKGKFNGSSVEGLRNGFWTSSKLLVLIPEEQPVFESNDDSFHGFKIGDKVRIINDGEKVPILSDRRMFARKFQGPGEKVTIGDTGVITKFDDRDKEDIWLKLDNDHGFHLDKDKDSPYYGTVWVNHTMIEPLNVESPVFESNEQKKFNKGDYVVLNDNLKDNEDYDDFFYPHGIVPGLKGTVKDRTTWPGYFGIKFDEDIGLPGPQSRTNGEVDFFAQIGEIDLVNPASDEIPVFEDKSSGLNGELNEAIEHSIPAGPLMSRYANTVLPEKIKVTVLTKSMDEDEIAKKYIGEMLVYVDLSESDISEDGYVNLSDVHGNKIYVPYKFYMEFSHFVFGAILYKINPNGKLYYYSSSSGYLLPKDLNNLVICHVPSLAAELPVFESSGHPYHQEDEIARLIEMYEGVSNPQHTDFIEKLLGIIKTIYPSAYIIEPEYQVKQIVFDEHRENRIYVNTFTTKPMIFIKSGFKDPLTVTFEPEYAHKILETLFSLVPPVNTESPVFESSVVKETLEPKPGLKVDSSGVMISESDDEKEFKIGDYVMLNDSVIKMPNYKMNKYDKAGIRPGLKGKVVHILRGNSYTPYGLKFDENIGLDYPREMSNGRIDFWVNGEFLDLVSTEEPVFE